MNRRQVRYLSAYIDPKSGLERLGTGGDAQAFHRYVSVENVIRFGLSGDAFPPGQYNIYIWTEGGEPRFVRNAFKRA